MPLPHPSLRDVSAYISTAARASGDDPHEVATARKLLRKWEDEYDGIAWRSEAIVRVLQQDAPARSDAGASVPPLAGAPQAAAWWVTAARLIGDAPVIVERLRAAVAAPLAMAPAVYPALPARRWRVEDADEGGEGRLLVRYNGRELTSEAQARILGDAVTERLIARLTGRTARQG